MIDKKEYYFFSKGSAEIYVFKVLDILQDGNVFANIFLASSPLYINKKNDKPVELVVAFGSLVWEESELAKFKLLEIFQYIFESDVQKLVGTYDEKDFRGIKWSKMWL